MKSALHFIAVICLAATGLKAQDLCHSFCITNMEMDSLQPNVMNVTIFFEGDENDFINYPYVSTVIDLNGDTIGTGSINFFGQIGNTSQAYPVNTVFDALPGNFKAYAEFVFDTVSCLLYYDPAIPCSTTGINDGEYFPDLKLYPNPFFSALLIETGEPFEELSLILFNSHGQVVMSMEELSGIKIKINREGLASGIYFLQLRDHWKIVVKKIIIQ